LTTNNPDNDYLEGLVREHCKLQNETEWVEFKVNWNEPQDIGEYISALANSAALNGKTNAYLLWGVDDESHKIIGTSFSPSKSRKGNEQLEIWLLRMLAPRIDFCFHEINIDGNDVVIMEIDCAAHQPVAFRGIEYIRVGSNKRKLNEFPEKERALWRCFDRVSFEDGIAASQVDSENVLLMLDYPAYFDLLGIPLPDGRSAIIDMLLRDKIIVDCEAGGFNITNLGAVLLAKKLNM